MTNNDHSRPSFLPRAQERTIYQILMVVITAICFSGCNQAPVANKQDAQTASNLGTLHRAYLKYFNENQRAPQNKDELLPFIAEEDQQNAFISTRDKQPYVIYWSTPIDYSQHESPVIIAHEKDGVSGSRYACSTFGLTELNDSEFAAAGLPRNQIE